MARNGVPLALRDRLGEPATAALLDFTENRHAAWRDEVLSLAAERFDRRLTEEISTLRVDMAQAVAGVRHDIATGRVEFIRWSFLFWIGQVAVIAGLLAFMLRTIPVH
jgi:hypothetical protein